MIRNVTFTPASIDALNKGSLKDPLTPGLVIEVLTSGKKAWKYARRVADNGPLVRLSYGYFPARTIADARKWAANLNDQVELGVDPREAMRIEEKRAGMTVARAHEFYMVAVREVGHRDQNARTSRAPFPTSSKSSIATFPRSLRKNRSMMSRKMI